MPWFFAPSDRHTVLTPRLQCLSRHQSVFPDGEATSAWLMLLNINRKVGTIATVTQVLEPNTVPHRVNANCNSISAAGAASSSPLGPLPYQGA